jgi:SAM-dependent methyltransferase
MLKTISKNNNKPKKNYITTINSKWVKKNSYQKKFGAKYPPSFPNEMLVRVCSSKRYGKYKININKKNFKVLEVGCFAGNNARFFIENKIKYYGQEISRQMIQLFKNNLKRLNYKIPEIRIGHNENIKYENNFFDLLISINTIHYSYGKKLEKALSEYARIIKKNGFAIIETPMLNHPAVKSSKKISDFHFLWGLKGFRKNTNIGFINDLKKFKKMILKYFKSFQINYKHEIYIKNSYSSYFFICKK